MWTRRTFGLALAAAAGCRRDPRPRLNVYNWSSYVAPGTIPGFERETGSRVRYAVYESNEEMLAKVMTGNSGWDVVFPTHTRIRPMVENGLLAPLNQTWLPNLSHLETRFQRPQWDPELRWSVPYMCNATGILYDSRRARPITRWADLWDGALQGRVTMLDDSEDALGACLKKLGYSFNASDPSQLRRAQQEAIAQKRLLRAYVNAEVRDQVVAGDVLVAQLWSSNSQQAIDQAPHLRFAFPEEGFPIYCDTVVVLRESRRQQLAHRLINYLLRPRVAADIVEAVKTATPNLTAQTLLPEALRSSATLFPPPEVLAHAEWPETLSAETQRLRDRLWTEIKAA